MGLFSPRTHHPVTGERYPTKRELMRDLKAQDKRYRNSDKAVRSAGRFINRAARKGR